MFKRILDLDVSSLSDEDLLLNAEEIFLALEKQEALYNA